MNNKLIIAILLVLSLCVLFSGCTDQSGQNQVPPSPTQTLQSLPMTPEVTPPITPEPVKQPTLFDQQVTTPPADLAVSVSVQKDPVYSTIRAIFDGGKGQDLVQSVVVKTTLSTGEDREDPLGKKKGDEITIPGSKGNDRVRVGVTFMNGQSYLISDTVLGQNRAGAQTGTPAPEKTPAFTDEGPYAGPVTTPPNSLSISVDVKKDPIYRVITGTFRGGHGQSLLSRIDMHAELGTGETVTRQIADSVGATTEIQGSDSTDRIQIVVFFKNGDQYKILEKTFGPRG